MKQHRKDLKQREGESEDDFRARAASAQSSAARSAARSCALLLTRGELRKRPNEGHQANIDFFPFVVGAHGGFGEKAKELWKILVGHAKKVQGRDWRHSWTAMSYSKVWEQKLSIALANAEAVGHQQRAPAVTRRLALGGRMDESGEGVYESSGDGGVDDRA